MGCPGVAAKPRRGATPLPQRPAPGRCPWHAPAGDAGGGGRAPGTPGPGGQAGGIQGSCPGEAAPSRLVPPPPPSGTGAPGAAEGVSGRQPGRKALSAAAVLGRGLFLFFYLFNHRFSACFSPSVRGAECKQHRASQPGCPTAAPRGRGGGKEPPGGAHRGAWHRPAPSPDPVCRRGARSEAACEGRELRGLGCAAVGRKRGLAGGRRAVQEPCRRLLGLSARGPEPRCSFGGWM